MYINNKRKVAEPPIIIVFNHSFKQANKKKDKDHEFWVKIKLITICPYNLKL